MDRWSWTASHGQLVMDGGSSTSAVVHAYCRERHNASVGAAKWTQVSLVQSIWAMRIRGTQRLPLTTRVLSIRAVSPHVGQSPSWGVEPTLTQSTCPVLWAGRAHQPSVSGSHGHGTECPTRFCDMSRCRTSPLPRVSRTRHQPIPAVPGLHNSLFFIAVQDFSQPAMRIRSNSDA
jgi:hypothetical protein